MRLISFLFLVAFGGAVALFAFQNRQEITLQFYDRSITANVSAVIGIAYGLGMLSGWALLGMLRRSVRRIAEPERGYIVSRT